MRHRFHILGIPYSISSPEYNVCAFTQKVVRLCRLLRQRGHCVIHYGHEDSQVDCDEHVTVMRRYDLEKTYGAHDWRRFGVPKYSFDDRAFRTFCARTIEAIGKRKEKHDFVLFLFGSGQKPVADAHPDLIICEPSIGYPNSFFAPFKAWESYAMLHAYGGLDWVQTMRNDMWYDFVIPSYIDPAEIEYSDVKDDYLLYLGRVIEAKGVHIAMQVAEAVNGRLIIAGPGSIDGFRTRTDRPVSDYVRYIGTVDVNTRKRLLARAKAAILPSHYVEAMCWVHVEAMMSGTPVITTDFGAFTEYNLHGVTGYRCRTFEHFVWAARNIERIRPAACREWAAANFSAEKVGDMYEEFFHAAKMRFDGTGWYEPNPGRMQLDWLTRHYPGQAGG